MQNAVDLCRRQLPVLLLQRLLGRHLVAKRCGSVSLRHIHMVTLNAIHPCLGPCPNQIISPFSGCGRRCSVHEQQQNRCCASQCALEFVHPTRQLEYPRLIALPRLAQPLHLRCGRPGRQPRKVGLNARRMLRQHLSRLPPAQQRMQPGRPGLNTVRAGLRRQCRSRLKVGLLRERQSNDRLCLAHRLRECRRALSIRGQ